MVQKTKDDIEVEEIRKDIIGLVEKRIGGKFYGHIVLHRGTESIGEGKENVKTTFIEITNIQYNKDSFELVKILLLNFKNLSDTIFQQRLGLMPAQGAREQIRGYQ